jgi:hypothetical protein
MKHTLLIITALMLFVGCGGDSNKTDPKSGSKSSVSSSSARSGKVKQVRFEGSYQGINNYGYSSTLTVMGNGSYISMCPAMDSHLRGKWKKESSNRIAFYSDDGFGGMSVAFSGRITGSGLQIDGGNFYNRQ